MDADTEPWVIAVERHRTGTWDDGEISKLAEFKFSDRNSYVVRRLLSEETENGTNLLKKLKGFQV